MIRVLLCDDQPLVLAGLRTILEAEQDVEAVGEARDGREAIALVRQLHPDVVLMDIRMPGMDGLEATRILLAADSPVRVVLLTTFDLDDYVYQGLRAGASGFLLKDLRDHELVAAVRAVARGETLLAPSVTRQLIEAYTSRSPATKPPGADELTPREHEVWQLMAEGLSNTEITQRLVLGEATVKTHVARVLSKLNARDRVQAVIMAYESRLV